MASKNKAMFNIEFKGVDDVIRRLKKLDDKVSKKIVRSAQRKAMKPMLAEVEKNAPVGEHGSLKTGAKLKPGKRSRKSISITVAYDKADIGSDKFWANFVEYGVAGGPKNPPSKNHGFMRKAYEDKKDECKEIAQKAILQGIEKEARKKK